MVVGQDVGSQTQFRYFRTLKYKFQYGDYREFPLVRVMGPKSSLCDIVDRTLDR